MSEERVAIVTGAAGGIGRAVAHRFASAGIRVVVADIRQERAAEVAAELSAETGTDVIGRAVDVTDSASCRVLGEGVSELWGRIDHLVNCAGMALDAPSLDHPDADWQRVVNLNLSGTFYMCREIGPHLIMSQGTIVNISSICAFAVTRPEIHVSYDATKAGIIALTRTLGVEWASRGVRVNAVAPGYTNTELLKNVGAGQPEIVESWISQIPQRRLMEPDDIANVVFFLSSTESVAITAQTILADGGYTAAK